MTGLPAPSAYRLPARGAARGGEAAEEPSAPPGPVPGPSAPPGPWAPPRHPPAAAVAVPPHRAGVVVRALLLVERHRGAGELVPRLERLVRHGGGPADAGGWADRLLHGALLGVRDARPYAGVLRMLAARPTARPAVGGRDAYGAPFWERLRLGEDERLDLLRRALPADAPHGPGCLEAAARRLAADPRGVQPLLCRWFTDDRPLPAGPGSSARPTVADAARALLHTHRGLAVDDLCEALVTTAHPHADGLLAALVRDEPAALCRAVDRWAHDDARPARRVAAAAYGPLLAARVTADADREVLRYAALALLARPGDHSLHGAALAVLVHDPRSRDHHLRQALAAFRAGDRALPARALTAALTTHPEPVLAAFRTRLRVGGPAAAADVLEALAGVRTPRARPARRRPRPRIRRRPPRRRRARRRPRRPAPGAGPRRPRRPPPARHRPAAGPPRRGARRTGPRPRGTGHARVAGPARRTPRRAPRPGAGRAPRPRRAGGAAGRRRPRGGGPTGAAHPGAGPAERRTAGPYTRGRGTPRPAPGRAGPGEVPGPAAPPTGRPAGDPGRRTAPRRPAAVTGRAPAAMPVRDGPRGHGTLRPAHR
ncbi:hypothetical protein LUX12_05710 [Streptomyces somaliensis]|uniref:hypothetical protein n=1 Tax=Streptomyces somaliensis TaxID=78355 RepID=UPI0020CFAE51|nr:hypothetical protein [Streptomyces somaliensis]MCP9944399.1 hypothetical protein [Streptomyces somaliensis]